jgi:hypothetical protein
MPSFESIFIYGFLCVPLLGGLAFMWYRCFSYWFDRDDSVYVVEPSHMVQHIHTTEPLEVAQPIQIDLNQSLQIAETMPTPVNLPSIVYLPAANYPQNQDVLYI